MTKSEKTLAIIIKSLCLIMRYNMTSALNPINAWSISLDLDGYLNILNTFLCLCFLINYNNPI